MKKFFFSILFLVSYVNLLFSAVPKWITDLEKEFPSEKYIRAVAEGNSLEEAKKYALAELSSYFSQTIESSVEATAIMQNEKNSNILSNEKINQKVSTKSIANLFSVHFTQEYNNKKKKTCSICAYLIREEAWSILIPKIDICVSNCKKILELIDKENELLLKMILLTNAESQYSDFYNLYEMALVIYPNKCNEFSSFAKNTIEYLTSISYLRKNISIQVNINGDKNNTIRMKITNLLEQKDFKITSQNSMYSLKASIEWNESQNNKLYLSYPRIEISIDGQNGLVKSLSGECEKIATSNKSATERTAIFKLEKLIEELFSSKKF
mgnify:CR=1 FL=1